MADKQSEAAMLRRLCIDEGVPKGNIYVETEALHSRENCENCLKIFAWVLREFSLAPNAAIGVAQAATNRARALFTAKSVLRDPRFKRYGLDQADIVTIDFPRGDLHLLSERDRVIELFRLFGLPRKPESEMRVCEEYCPAAIRNMSSRLKERARLAEKQFHLLLEENPSYVDYFRGALETMDPGMGGMI